MVEKGGNGVDGEEIFRRWRSPPESPTLETLGLALSTIAGLYVKPTNESVLFFKNESIRYERSVYNMGRPMGELLRAKRRLRRARYGAISLLAAGLLVRSARAGGLRPAGPVSASSVRRFVFLFFLFNCFKNCFSFRPSK
jgi:hypothetical protein